MKKSLVSILSVFTSLMLCASFTACSSSVDYEVKAPTVQQSASVVSVANESEVGLKSGFPLSHEDGKVDNVYDYDDDYYYFNNNKIDGR